MPVTFPEARIQPAQVQVDHALQAIAEAAVDLREAVGRVQTADEAIRLRRQISRAIQVLDAVEAVAFQAMDAL